MDMDISQAFDKELRAWLKDEEWISFNGNVSGASKVDEGLIQELRVSHQLSSMIKMDVIYRGTLGNPRAGIGRYLVLWYTVVRFASVHFRSQVFGIHSRKDCFWTHIASNLQLNESVIFAKGHSRKKSHGKDERHLGGQASGRRHIWNDQE